LAQSHILSKCAVCTFLAQFDFYLALMACRDDTVAFCAAPASQFRKLRQRKVPPRYHCRLGQTRMFLGQALASSSKDSSPQPTCQYSNLAEADDVEICTAHVYQCIDPAVEDELTQWEDAPIQCSETRFRICL